MHHISRKSALFLSLVLLCAMSTKVFGSESSDSAEIAPGASRKIVLDERAGPFRRSFRLHVPISPGDSPKPLVVALHGGFASGRILERQTDLSEVADRHDFFAVYPNGLGIWSLARHWNGGYCCAKALASGLDDVGFLDRVIAWVQERYAINPEQIYVIGYSNGGMLAYWYAAERADKLAGLGIWASSIGLLEEPAGNWALPQPAAALPAIIAHGTADPRLPFDTEAGRGGQQLLGAVGSAVAWAESNGCNDPPSTSRSREEQLEYRTWCPEGANPVTLVGVEGWGHEWPGPKRTGALPGSDPLAGFHLAEEMWEFFRRLGIGGDGAVGQSSSPQPESAGRR